MIYPVYINFITGAKSALYGLLLKLTSVTFVCPRYSSAAATPFFTP
ncbi:hypothetical protein CASFOL_002630 [Castilleja foliolosa]|uniref:Uncharacterized protein n=1 Tax=Castilleja foliolosa TaxID=1961234 RepID=A0ABD3EFE7_9LAMI